LSSPVRPLLECDKIVTGAGPSSLYEYCVYLSLLVM